MWHIPALTIAGLVLNLIGAITLIGNQWRPTANMGYRLKPQFKHIDNGLRLLGNQHERIGPDDPELEPLFDLVDSPTDQFTVPARGPITPTEILPPTDENDNKAVFVEEVETGASNFSITQNTRVEMDTLEKWAQNSFQTWFIKVGAILIAIGFFFRIIAEIPSLI
jgi:hypothetical protein